VVVIAEMPDAIRATAFSPATSAGGALKAIKTTPHTGVSRPVDERKRRRADTMRRISNRNGMLKKGADDMR
jgi:hypothetical protein